MLDRPQCASSAWYDTCVISHELPPCAAKGCCQLPVRVLCAYCPCLNDVVALCCRLLACFRCLCYRLYLGGGLGVCGDSPALHLPVTASPAASSFPGCYRLVNRPTAVARPPGSASSSEAGGLGASGPLFVKAPLQTCVLHAAGSGF